MSPEQLNAVFMKRLEDLMVAQAKQMREKDALIAALGKQNADL